MEKAAAVGGEAIVITFYPHPRSVVGTYGGEVGLLNSLEEKCYLLEKLGIHHLVVVPFTRDFADQSAEEYCTTFLHHYFHPHTIIIGYDHRFGKNRSGDYRLLEQMGTRLGFQVTEIAEEVLAAVKVSSTSIRKALATYEIKTANQLLGYPYFFEGVVVKGNQLGRTIGYPTANIQVNTPDKLIPADGVYSVSLLIKPLKDSKQPRTKTLLLGMMNIGIRPTVSGKSRVIEVHIFNFSEDIYGATLQVHVHGFLRKETKFSGLDALINQLEVDAIDAKKQLVVHNFT